MIVPEKIDEVLKIVGVEKDDNGRHWDSENEEYFPLPVYAVQSFETFILWLIDLKVKEAIEIGKKLKLSEIREMLGCK